MTSQGKAAVRGRTAIPSTYDDLAHQLRDLCNKLRDLVDDYEGSPGALDEAMKHSADDEINPEEVIIEIYRLMRNRVFTQVSPLRVNHELWEAFTGQQHEFLYFYKSARRALEVYGEVLRAYAMLEPAKGEELKRGDVKRIRKDKNAQVDERDRCIEAISYLHGKVSAMLAVL